MQLMQRITGRWKTHPCYKDSGLDGIGDIPSHWNTGKIWGIASVKARLGWKGLKASEYVDKGYILLSTPNIKNKEIDFENVNYITADRYLESPEIMLQERDILIAKDGSTLGITNVIRELPFPATVNSSIAVIRPKRHLNSIFIYYFLSSTYVQEIIQMMKDGMGVPHLFQADLRKFPLLIPPTNEQESIVVFLDREIAKIDALIAKKERLIELLQEKRAAIISHAVTKGLGPNVPMKDSGIEWMGEIPEHWVIRKLKFDVSFYGGGTPSKGNLDYWDGSIPWVSPKDMKSELIADAEDHITEEAVKNSATRVIPSGAVLLVVRSGILRHSIPVAENVIPVSLNQDMKALIPRKSLSAIYLRYFIVGHQNPLLIEWRKEGTTVESIEFELLANTFVLIPTIPEQHAIANFLHRETAKIDDLIYKIHVAIEKLVEYRSALISAAVTGKIDVRDKAHAGETV